MKKVILLLMLIGIALLNAGEWNSSVKGIITDADTGFPIPHVNVVLSDSTIAVSSDEHGNYKIDELKPGVYTFDYFRVGFNKEVIVNQIVKPNRTLQLDVKLKRRAFVISGVKAKKQEYFTEPSNNEVSSTGLDNEEIRRAPGAAGDISRMLTALPAVSSSGGSNNNLVVRGGNPIENGFYVDGIAIPNISHFPGQGVTGGPIGLLNVDFIKNIEFSSGGFSTAFNNKLSSVSDISFRTGNDEKYDFQASLDFIGYGFIAEGPIKKEKSSFMVALRRSYLDLITEMVDLGTSSVPWYGDLQGKFAFDIDNNNKLSFLFVSGDDHSNTTREQANDEDMLFYGDQDVYVNTVGANWRRMLGTTTSHELIMSWNSMYYNEEFFEPATGLSLVANNSHQQKFTIKNKFMHQFNPKNLISGGLSLQMNMDKIDNSYGESLDQYGNIETSASVKEQRKDLIAGAYAEYDLKTFDRMSINGSVSCDYYQANDELAGSYRVMSRYQVFDNTYLKGAIGRYNQELPSVLLVQQNEDYPLMTTDHYIAGLEQILTSSLKLTLEVYHKEYKNMPIDPDTPELFVLDEPFYDNGLYSIHPNLVAEGEAVSEGIELSLQKKMIGDFYGMVSGTYFRSRYTSLSGNEYDRSYDNRFFANVQLGYRPSFSWEFSGKWTWSGGAPYTPFDEEASLAAGQGVLDTNRINGERYPDYHSLDLRVDKRFFFNKSSVVTYLSVWNVYNRQNVGSYYWNPFENEKDTVYNWGMLPVLGIEYEF